MKTFAKTLVLVALVGVMFYGFDAFAQSGTNAWQRAFKTLINVFNNVRTLVYVIGAFGLIGIAIGGIMGKIKWVWLGYLAAGLAIVAGADMIIRWAVKDQSTGTEKINIDDWNDSY